MSDTVAFLLYNSHKIFLQWHAAAGPCASSKLLESMLSSVHEIRVQLASPMSSYQIVHVEMRMVKCHVVTLIVFCRG